MDQATTSFLTIIGAGAASYFGAYIKRKGEDRAVMEGFAEVLRQTKETTAATKKIEAKITDEMWDRQKRWELKVQILLEAIKRIAALDDGLSDYKTFARLDKDRTSEGAELDLHWSGLGLETKKKWQKVLSDFDETRYFVSAICSRVLKDALDNLGVYAHQFGAELAKGNVDAESQGQKEFLARGIKARLAIRKELGEDASKSLSNKSSAAPIPDAK
jgi:hypothetical protein